MLNINALFDLRLGYVATKRPKEVFPLLEEKWANRKSDLLISETLNKDYEQVKADLCKGNEEYLKNSMVTPMLGFIADMIQENTQTSTDGTGILEYELHLNTYPYSFELEVEKELRMSILELLPMVRTLEFISMSTNQLTPDHMRRVNYDISIDYNGIDWLAQHQESLVRANLRECILIVPSLYKAIEYRDNENRDTYGDLDIFGITEFSTAPYITLRYIPITDFNFNPAFCPSD